MYCKICGKIGEKYFFETVPTDNNMHRMLNSDEIYEKYKDLEQVQIDDDWQGYIPITKGEDDV